MNNKFIAIVGLGSIGYKHLKIIKKIKKSYKIIAIRSGKGEDVRTNLKPDIILTSIQESLKYNLVAAFICSPSVNHINDSLFFAKNNIKIFVEKPLTGYLENTDKLLSLVKKKNLVSQVGYVFKFDKAALFFKKLIDQKIIGKKLKIYVQSSSYLPDWRKGRDYKKTVSANKKLGGGALLELSHEIDYVLWFFDDVKSIFASFGNSNTLNIDIEDNIDILINTYENYSISINLNFNQKKIERYCRVIGTKGEIKWNLNSNSIEINKLNLKKSTIFFKENSIIKFEKQLKYFFTRKNFNQGKINSIDSAINTSKIINLAYKSNKKNKVIFT